jgi:hypothetical protein
LFINPKVKKLTRQDHIFFWGGFVVSGIFSCRARRRIRNFAVEKYSYDLVHKNVLHTTLNDYKRQRLLPAEYSF